MSQEKQIEDQSEVLYGGRREGGKRFAEMCAKAFEDAEAHPENYDDMFAGYENDLNKAVALIEWQKQEIESLTIRMNAFGLAIKSLAEERDKYFLCKENGEVVPLTKQAEWISVDERLPEENVYVLIAVENSIQVARIIKGISEEEREKMKNGELPDPEELCFAADKIITLRRSQLYRSGDVWGNNLVPYYWKANGGPMEWFGQNITHWMPLPEAPKMKGGGE